MLNWLGFGLDLIAEPGLAHISDTAEFGPHPSMLNWIGMSAEALG